MIVVEPLVRKTPPPRIETIARVLLVLSTLLVAAIALVYLLLALPANDDFLRAARAVQPSKSSPWIQLDYWPYCKYLYLHWQGRWTSFAIEAAVLPHSQMTRFYPGLIGAVAIGDLLGLYVVCRFFTRLASRWFSLACTGALAAMLWTMMPSLAQTVHWFVGGVENLLVLSMAGLLLVGLMSPRAKVPWMNSASVLAVVTTGFHEAYGAMLCIALTVGTVAAFRMKAANRRAWLTVLIAAAIGLAIVVLCPGNRVRVDRDVAHRVRAPLVILKLAGKQFWDHGRDWLFDPKLLTASLFVAFSPGLEMSRPVWSNARKVPWRLLIPLAWLAMLAVGFVAPSWAFVDVMPGRTLSGNFVVFAMGWLIIVFIFTRDLDQREIFTAGLRNSAATSIALLILAVSLLFGANTIEAVHDLAGRKVLRWHASVENRYAMLRRSRGKDLVVPTLPPWSNLFYSGEIYTDSIDWHNQPLADFFGVRSVSVKPQKAATRPVKTDDPSQNM